MKKNSLLGLQASKQQKTNYSIVVLYLMDQKLGINLILSVETKVQSRFTRILDMGNHAQ
jgi:hypothetical protein